MKICSKCKIEKELSEFSKDKTRPDGYCYWCKSCGNLANKKRYKVNHKKKLQACAIYRKENKQKIKERRIKLKKEKPWYSSYWGAKNRCTNTNNPDYPYYGGRAIKFLLTQEEYAKLWERDKGWLLEQHSIERKDNDGNYTFENCRFIEMNENRKKGNKTK